MSDDECANPLLVRWAKEWYDKAREQNSKGQFTYKKAYESLKACPLPFEHPSQAQELKGLGPKLCDRLVEKLKEHCSQNGLPMPEDPRNKGKKRANDDTAPEPNDNEAAPGPSKRARTTKPKTYVPALRSGAYAIMLALATLPDPEVDPRAGLTKNQIVNIAQQHCDSSFTAPSDPSKTYTAWSSLKTLMNKDLVCVGSGASKKYMLTDDGWDVAKRIVGAAGLDRERILDPTAKGGNAGVGSSTQDAVAMNGQTDGESGRLPSGSQIADSARHRELSARPTATVNEQLQKSASQPPGGIRKTNKTDNASIQQLQRSSVSPPEAPMPPRRQFRMKDVDLSILASHEESQRPTTENGQNISRHESCEVICLDDSDSEPDGASNLPRKASGDQPLLEDSNVTIDSVLDVTNPTFPLSGDATTRCERADEEFAELFSRPPPEITERPRRPLQPINESELNIKDAIQSEPCPQATGCTTLGQLPYSRENSGISRALPPDQTKTSLPQIPSDISPIRVPPGSFAVELLIDTREVRSRTDRTYLQDGLLAQGIHPHTRALELGDVLWVARIHDPAVLALLNLSAAPSSISASDASQADPQSASNNPQAEIVLPYALERKRLDDLIASLKDGRYHEQKFRLRRSGLKNLTYLIEDINLSVDVRQKWHEAVKTAIAATIVQDGFFVRRTKSLDESIKYLARLTKAIRTEYSQKELWVLPESELERLEAPAKNRQQADKLLAGFLEARGEVLMTYPAFSARSAKDAARTVRAVYLRMLMASKGVTAWKARAIQRKYPTPRALVEAYEQVAERAVETQRTRKEQGEMLSKELGHWSFGKGKLGKAVSVKVAGVWAGIGD